MTIREASKKTGAPTKTIRLYESVGLVASGSRRDNGRGGYSDRDIQIIRFIQDARRMGYSVVEASLLLSLWSDNNGSGHEAKNLVFEQIDEIDRRIEELRKIQKTLKTLTTRRPGNDRHDRPIMDNPSRPAPDFPFIYLAM